MESDRDAAYTIFRQVGRKIPRSDEESPRKGLVWPGVFLVGLGLFRVFAVGRSFVGALRILLGIRWLEGDGKVEAQRCPLPADFGSELGLGEVGKLGRHPF